MPVHNAEIAELFYEYADLLEIEGANPFRVRAYRNAARTISNLSRNVAEMVHKGEDLSQLPGLGKDLARKVEDIVNTGKLSQLVELKKRLPPELIDITKLAGLGPKRAGTLYKELGITSIKQLEEAAKHRKIRELPGFAAKMEQKILEEVTRKGTTQTDKKRFKLSVIEGLAHPLIEYLKKVDGVKNVEVAGSYRRKKETIGDLDILVTHTRGSEIMKRFLEYEDVQRVISRGETRSTVELRFGIQVDVRAVPDESYGAALHYFTGSQAHNIAIRKRGVKKGLKINEYGVFENEKRIAGKTEEEVYASVDLPFIEPELRENNGEIESAQAGSLPYLITLDILKGDLHAHTKATDGRSTMEEMALAAREKGYEYLAITDHSKHMSVAKGFDTRRLEEQIDEIDQLNEKMDGITLLKGIEVDILEDGSLDLPQYVLKKLDLVVCAIHSKFNLPAEKQAERIKKAMENRFFTILAHPTGRLIGERDPYDVDMEKVMEAAKDTGSILELNAQPERLDINETHAKMAKEMNVLVAISTDAHSTNEFEFMRYGVYQARRGWLESDDVVNTRSLKELKKLIGKK